MGCLMSKKSKNDQNKTKRYSSRGSITRLSVSHVSTKEYSWSNREKKDLSQYIIENVADRVEIRLPGEIEGQQFLIQNCSRATICLYDYSNTVMIDDCTDCTFFIGPVMGSIAVRNCDDCRLMSASQQFRTRDCKRFDLFLFCGTQPAIESCSQLRFGCFSANYSSLKDQFTKAGLNEFNNKWSQVYDFSIDDQERHWNTFPSDVKATDYFCAMLMGNPVLNLSFNASTSLVPQTLGITSLEFLQKSQSDFYPSSNSFDSNNLPTVSTEEGTKLCLVFVYGYDQNGAIDLELQRLLQEINLKNTDVTLLMTKSFQPEQVSLKLCLITEEEAISGLAVENSPAEVVAKNTSMAPPNRLLVLFYQGNENLPTILVDTCSRVFGAATASTCFKIVTDDNEENTFAHYLSIAFENLISY